MYRIFFFLIVSLLLSCMHCVHASQSQPNVLFIAVDDLNDWVGFMGGYPGKVHTPNMDRLASRGTAFLNAHTASPVCCPSRAAVMSGQLPSTSGIYTNRQVWKPNLPGLITIPANFKTQGYTTVGAGKIFHHTVGHNHPQLWHQYQRLDFRDNPNAKQDKSQYPFTETADDPDGFPFSGITLYSKEVDWGALAKPEAEFDDTLTAQFCVDFLSQESDKHFFLACGIFRPHMPWYFPKKYLDLYPLNYNGRRSFIHLRGLIAPASSHPLIQNHKGIPRHHPHRLCGYSSMPLPAMPLPILAKIVFFLRLLPILLPWPLPPPPPPLSQAVRSTGYSTA